ncbi:helix-turn-helix domain-containing protein [Streptomyces umbrinus]|uniref:helix-turn-helix domain-containing protein n=1 Tax=Streptomyces umbrinus TaxID=67370 RepID=UPI0027D8B141|nr:helix-turn-helix domain-containing protein [Streptomyces umbrinus]
MQLRYNYRVCPDATQRRALAQAFGCARVRFPLPVGQLDTGTDGPGGSSHR